MEKSKKIFIIISIVVMVLCIVVFMLSNKNNNQPAVVVTFPLATGDTASEGGPTDTAGTQPIPTIQNPPATAPTIPEESIEVKLSPNVTMLKVEKDPNEIIIRTDEYNPEDPEFTEDEVFAYHYSGEGRVYRNDKVITIEIYDALEDFTHSISFGYITGGCNRFLYLNPTINSEYATHYAFHFTRVSDAGVIQSIRSEDNIKKVKHYSILRALDQRTPANYIDPHHPGTVWYTPSALEGTQYIDCVVMTLNGDWIATIRIHIAKDPADGTYSIVNLENKNLMQDDAKPYLTEQAVQYLYEASRQMIDNPQQLGLYHYTLKEDVLLENFIMEYRDYSTGLYYDYFYLHGSVVPVQTREHTKGNPVIAVTYRHFTSTMVLTLYYEVYTPPSGNNPGVYKYIGRDETYYRTIKSMNNKGYPGLT